MDFKIIQLWHWLNNEKKLYEKEVFNRVYKDALSSSQLEEEQIRTEIDQNGFYDVKNAMPPGYIEVLESFVKKGYVDKYTDTLYRIDISWEYYLYSPYMSIEGNIGIKGPKVRNMENKIIGSKEYRNFIESCKILKNEVDLGYHRHIDSIEYNILYDYETVVYEIKDKYLDAIEIRYNADTGIYEITIVEPVIKDQGERIQKTHRVIQPTNLNFFDGAIVVDSLLDSLNDRRENGIIIYNNEPYQINNNNKKNLTNSGNTLSTQYQTLNYIGKDIFDIHNLFSRIFEDSLAAHLRKLNYANVVERYRTGYFESDVDVYAVCTNPNKLKLFCECKFRVFDQELTKTDVLIFIKKTQIIQNAEPANRSSLKFWLVTNTKNIPDDIKKLCQSNNIELIYATVTRNWRKNALWKIQRIESVT